MRVKHTSIEGVSIVEGDSFEDDRGAFARLYCSKELENVLGARSIVQINRSITRDLGAVRGLHFQYAPSAEMKLIRCLSGRVFDVAVDLRRGSPTLMQWTAVELAEGDRRCIVIPEGCAHGFQALDPNSELLYLHTAYYTPSREGAVRFDDPRIAIQWPLVPTHLSARDLSHQPLSNEFDGLEI